jgi:RimJ/RimL family protein N-acetyltransferase
VRPIEERDTDALIQLFADPELSRFHPRDLTRADQVREIAAKWRAYDGPPGTGVQVIERDGRLAGVAHLRVSTSLGGVLECGWYIAREYWGTGLASEVATTLRTTGLAMRGAVFAVIHEDNTRARRFTERLGFLDVGGGEDEYYGGAYRVLLARS